MVMSPEQQFIQQIQAKILRSDQEFALDGYAGSIDRLQKAFPRYGSFRCCRKKRKNIMCMW